MASVDISPEHEHERGGGDGEVEEGVKNEGEEVKDEETPEKKGKKKLEVLKDDLKEEEEEVEEGEGKEKRSSLSDKEAVMLRERPARERKAVERYAIATPASRASGKPIEIVKGNGTSLRDIPNVAFKLSKRKGDDNLQHLHTILYGKKAKAHLLKKDIGQFSGFAWTDNEEKQRSKVKDKLDKCVKEKLLDFCDVLNIPVSRSVVKKEDLSVKLLEFLESPHATTELSLAEKDQKTKKPKRKTSSTKSRSSKGTSAEKSAKKDSSGGKRRRSPNADEDNEADDKDDVESQSHSSEEEDDALNKEEGDDEDTNSEKDHQREKKMTIPRSSSKDNSGAKSAKKSTNTKKTNSEKSTKSSVNFGKKTAVTSDKSTPAAEAPFTSKGKRSEKQKVEEETKKEKPVPAKEKSTSKNQESKSAAKDQGKKKVKKPVKSEPTNEDLRAEAVNILKVVDFNTATLSDILRLLGTHFDLDLMHRKAEVKSIITDVIENMSNPGDDEEDEDSDIGAQDSGED